MSGACFVSVAVCTYNRSELLRKCLRAVREQSGAGKSWELLVVDNHSTDATRAVTEEVLGGFAPFRYLFCAQLGLSAARNLALAEARGEFILYLDDDAIPEATWLAAFCEATSRFSPAVHIVGGKVLPLWPAPRPRWLTENLLPALSVVDRGDKERDVLPDELLVGANMAFRTEALRRVGGFDLKLGRVGTALLSGEESQVRHRLEESGGTARYVPTMVVHHLVHLDRLHRRWFLRRYVAFGRTEAILLAADGRRIPLGVRSLLSALLQLLRRPFSPESFTHVLLLARTLARLYGRMFVARPRQ